MWSNRAYKEGKKFVKHAEIANKNPKKNYNKLPDPESDNININAKSGYLFYCDNETKDGTEFPYIPDSKGIPLVCDMTSNFATRPFDMSRFGVVYASS